MILTSSSISEFNSDCLWANFYYERPNKRPSSGKIDRRASWHWGRTFQCGTVQGIRYGLTIICWRLFSRYLFMIWHFDLYSTSMFHREISYLQTSVGCLVIPIVEISQQMFASISLTGKFCTELLRKSFQAFGNVHSCEEEDRSMPWKTAHLITRVELISGITV